MTDQPNFKWTEMLDDQKSFRVMDLVELNIVGPIWWHSEEMESEDLKGTIFRAYDPDKYGSSTFQVELMSFPSGAAIR
jgi:hypothetical protein